LDSGFAVGQERDGKVDAGIGSFRATGSFAQASVGGFEAT